MLTVHSREKQRMLKDHSARSSSSAAANFVLESSLKTTADLRLSEAEQRLSKHK